MGEIEYYSEVSENSEDLDFHVYVKQDGMYQTQELLISDEHKSSRDLPPYWYLVGNDYKTFKEATKYIYDTFWEYFDLDYKQEIKVNLEDKYILNRDDLKIMLAEYFLCQ